MRLSFPTLARRARSAFRPAFVTAGVTGALVTVGLVGSACSYGMHGSGRVTTEVRAASDFTRVRIESGFPSDIGVGPRTVDVTIDDNLQRYVDPVVGSETLLVRERPGMGLSFSEGTMIRVRSELIERVELVGGCSAHAEANGDTVTFTSTGGSHLDGVVTKASRVDVTSSGSSDVALHGIGAEIHLDVSGASHFTTDIEAESVEIDASGGSAIVVHASKSVRVRASGASDVTIIGNPATRDVTTSGGSTVRFVDE
ncbi:GIN domain-containing protein [Labilithrix luteola]|nr:DUF2807 domain-containing protein [Labilithrix luteola]